MTSAILLTLAWCTQFPAIEPDLDIALGTSRLNVRNARFDPNILRLFRQGEFTIPIYDSIYENPWRAPIFAENIKRELAVSGSKPQDSIVSAARFLGAVSRRSLVSNPNQAIEESSKKPGALKAVFEDWKTRGWIAGAIPSTDSIPKEVQSAAALILSCVPKSIEFRRLALLDTGDVSAAFALSNKPYDDSTDSSKFEARRRIGQRIDMPYLVAGAFDLSAAVYEAHIRLAQVGSEQKFAFKLATKWGMIQFNGSGGHSYTDSTLLAIDSSGEETYLNCPSNSTANQPISVVIDLEGKDKYLSDVAIAATEIAKWPQRKDGGELGGPGSARFGYSYLIDRQGDDLYRSHRASFGSATYGVSVLMDLGGDDRYDTYADSIGFANFGIGIVDDAHGKDTYLGFSQVQACGQTMGAGILIDRSGNDFYDANDAVIDLPSAQSAEHNSNMSQGVGNGRRGDYLDGHSLAGGVGVLLDLAGDDSYSCGVFGQGVGYWEGVGMLLDVEGQDRYKGKWYVQGAAAHYAVGYLEDEAGIDQYEAPINMAMGAGHDFSLGVLIDRMGDDSYFAPNLSLGAGNANGIGWFLDCAGNDKYSSTGITLGSSAESPRTSLRNRALCLGVFMDLGGDDAYPPIATWAKNASRTAQVINRGPNPEESQLGVFWDR